MTNSVRTLSAPGMVFFTRRQRLSNQERVDCPMPLSEALAISKDVRVPTDSRVLALHRAMDIAIGKKAIEASETWVEIDEVVRAFGPDLPILALRRFKASVPMKGASLWARNQERERNAPAPVTVSEEQAVAA